jgi:hypothetical protein
LCKWDFGDWLHAIALYDQYLFAGTRDGLIWMLDRHDPESKRVAIKGHFDSVSALVIGAGLLLSASLDGTLRRWPLKDLIEKFNGADTTCHTTTTTTTISPPWLTEQEEEELRLLAEE